MNNLTPTYLRTSLLAICLFISANSIANKNINDVAVDVFNSIYKNQYDLYIPDHAKNEKLPLYILLPGGVGEKHFDRFRDSLIVPGLAYQKGIIFSPKISWKRPDQKLLENILIDFIAIATKEYPVDRNKITLIGYSKGAIQATKLIQQKSYLFSAVVLMVSNLKITRKIDIPIYIIQGTKDRYFSIKKAHKAISYAESLGCNITFNIAEGKHDYDPTQYKSELNDLTHWLQKNIW